MKIQVDELVARYREGDPVVGRGRPLSLEVESGSMVGLIGPNGSGKSTLLRVLARLHKPASGRVILGDRDLAAMGGNELARTVAVVHQNPPLPSDISVQQLVSHGRYPHIGFLERLSGAEAHIVDGAIERCDLGHLAHRKVSELSGGERQRAWLAMAVAQQPSIMLLDEPTSALDVAHQLSVLTLLAELNQDRGITVVIVLHDVNLALRFCDRVVALRGGDPAFDERVAALPDGFESLLSDLYGTPVFSVPHPDTGERVCLFGGTP